MRGRRWGFSLEEVRQWLLIYEREGTETQMKTFVELADRQLGELQRQRDYLDETMSELQSLRDETAESLG